MSDRLSPLQGHNDARVYTPGQGEAGIVIRERSITSLVQVAAWPETLERIEDAIASLTHCAPPQRPTGSSARDETVILAIGPGRFLVESADPKLAAELGDVVSAEMGAVTDLSHARVVIRISGPKATWVLSKGLALDLDSAVFPALQVAQSAIHEIGVVVRRLSAERFDLYVYRGFALSFWEWLTEAAAESGYRIDPPGST